MPIDDSLSLFTELKKLVYGQTKVLKSGDKSVCVLELRGDAKMGIEEEAYERFGKDAELSVRLKFNCDRIKEVEPFATLKRGGSIDVQTPNGKTVGAFISIDPMITEKKSDEEIEAEMRKEYPDLYEDEDEEESYEESELYQSDLERLDEIQGEISEGKLPKLKRADKQVLKRLGLSEKTLLGE